MIVISEQPALLRSGAAGVLVGFGGGSAHTTKTVLGISVPMASAVAEVASARRDYLEESGGRYVHVIADGSVGSITISPQFVVKVKVLFLNGGLTSGGVMFFTE